MSGNHATGSRRHKGMTRSLPSHTSARRFAALAAVSALALVACGDDSDSNPGDTSGPDGPSVLAIDGATYLSDTVTGQTLVDGSRLTLNFDGGRLGASAGCNSMGGDFTVDDGVLTVGDMAMTEMACDEPLMTQEQWYAQFLTSGPTITQDGDRITLVSGDVTLVMLDREVADPDRPLEGTTWIIDSMIDADSVSSVGVTGTLVFEDGTVSVDTGCNTGSATYTVADDGTVTFGALGLTKMACPKDGANEMESAMVQVLTGTVTVEIEAASITLTNGDAGLGGTAQK